MSIKIDFYSRPCGRGDPSSAPPPTSGTPFLLTPLREGRRVAFDDDAVAVNISTHAPAGGATRTIVLYLLQLITFLLTPLREGRRF